MMKSYIIKITILISLLIVNVYVLYNKNEVLKERISVSMTNQKVFIAENSSLKEENRVFRFTIEQLNYYNDSILEKMNEVRKELKIKDDNLKQLQYLLSEAIKKDTIVFRDTLFRESILDIDTIIEDKWYSIY